MKIGSIESIRRCPVKGMRGEEIPHGYAGFAGLMGNRVFGVIAEDGDPALCYSRRNYNFSKGWVNGQNECAGHNDR